MTETPTHFLTIIPGHSLLTLNESTGIAIPTLGENIAKACQAWLKSPSRDTRSNYDRDLRQLLARSP